MSREGQASAAALSRELGINPKTVAKRRKRQTVEDRKTGPKEPRSTVLSEAEEAMIVAFRPRTLLPLDDRLYALQPTRKHPHAYGKVAYHARNVVERMFCRLKDFRRVATRYGKRADFFLSTVFLVAAVVCWTN